MMNEDNLSMGYGIETCNIENSCNLLVSYGNSNFDKVFVMHIDIHRYLQS